MAGFGGSLGRAVGYIELIYRSGAAAAARRDLQQTQKTAGKVGKGMLAVGLGIAAGFGYAINTAADFEKQISAIGAVTGASEKDLEAYRKKALQIGADTAFSASQGALAIEELAKAGLTLPDIMNGAADATVALAAAGEIDLPQAATIASNAMNQFQLSAEQLPHIADLLAGAANASAIGVEDLGLTLKYVGPVANAVGVSIEDVATATAILGNNGIKADSAGTALRSMLAQLAPTTKPAINAFHELGLITEDGTNLFVDAQGEIKPLAQVMQILNDKTKNLSATERNTFYKTAFGTETLAAASVLGGQTAASFDKMSASIAKVKSADVAKARLDNFKGAIDSFKGSMETAAIIVGSIFLPIFTNITRAITGLIGKFAALSPTTQKIIAYVAAFLGVLLLIGGAILTVVATVGALSGVLTAGAAAFGGIGAVVGATIGPILAIVAAVALVVAGLIYAYKHFEGFRKVIQGIIGVVKTVAKAIVSGLVSAFNFLRGHVDDVVAFFQAFIGKLKEVGRSIYSSIKPSIDSVVGQSKSVMSAVIPVAKGMGC